MASIFPIRAKLEHDFPIAPGHHRLRPGPTRRLGPTHHKEEPGVSSAQIARLAIGGEGAVVDLDAAEFEGRRTRLAQWRKQILGAFK